MSREERLARLSASAQGERQELAVAVAEVRRRVEEKRERWTSLGFWAGMLATGTVSAFRAFGRNSFSARLGRWNAMGAILIAVARFLFRLFR